MDKNSKQTKSREHLCFDEKNSFHEFFSTKNFFYFSREMKVVCVNSAKPLRFHEKKSVDKYSKQTKNREHLCFDVKKSLKLQTKSASKGLEF